MATRSLLSSLLVQRGLVSVSDLQDALAVQVVRGGTLDTALLEREAVPESTLLALLAEVTGYDGLTRMVWSQVVPEAAPVLSEELARAAGACPVLSGGQPSADAASAGSSVCLLVHEGAIPALTQLGRDLGQPIVPCISTELRVEQALYRVYGLEPRGRFRLLLQKCGESPPPGLDDTVDQEQSEKFGTEEDTVIDGRPGPAAEQSTPAAATSGRSAASGFQDGHDEPTLPNSEPLPNYPTSKGPVSKGPVSKGTADAQPAQEDWSETTAAGAALFEQPSQADLSEVTVTQTQQAKPPGEAPANATAVTLTDGVPLPTNAALTSIQNAVDRDQLLLALIYGAAYHFSIVKLFAIDGRALSGRYAITTNNSACALDDAEVRKFRIPLEAPSVVSRAVTDKALYLGPVPNTDASVRVLRAVGLSAPSVAVVPVVLGGKTVCALVAPLNDSPIPPRLRTPLAQLAQAAGDALVKLILKAKQKS